MNRLLRYALLTLAVVSAAGCKAWTPLEPHDRSLLKSIELASDAVQLEVISVRFPYGQDEINGAMWNEIDEQQIAEDVRRRLGENGLRVGLVGRELPGPLAQMIASRRSGRGMWERQRHSLSGHRRSAGSRCNCIRAGTGKS